MTSVPVVVVADDRSGAIETAAAIADSIGTRISVVPWTAECSHELGQRPPRTETGGGVAPIVIDIGSRHLSPAEAAHRATMASTSATHHLHKIDSTLRGNWASEIEARSAAIRRSVVLVPALPRQGRVCAGGVVLQSGVPVSEGPAGRDPLNPVATSRPAEHLRQAGFQIVDELHAPSDLVGWQQEQRRRAKLHDARGVAVCDAHDLAAITALAKHWATDPTTIFAATSDGIAAAVTELARVLSSNSMAFSEHSATLIDARSRLSRGTVLVVCGSLHPSARSQFETLASMIELTKAKRVRLLNTPYTPSMPSQAQATAAAAGLAAEVNEVLRSSPVEALVIVGGDTTAAVLGDVDVDVIGTIAPGTALSRWNRTHLLTRPGSFGEDSDLVHLLSLERPE